MFMACKNQRGMALVAAMLILLALTIMGTVSINTTLIDTKISGNMKDIKQAFFLADAGISHAGAYLEQNVASWDSYVTHQTLINTATLSAGTYMVTIQDGGGDRRKVVSTGTTNTGATAQIEAMFGRKGKSPFDFAVFGDKGITHSGGYVDSYNSSIAPWTFATHSTNGDIGTNSTNASAIKMTSDQTIYGDAYVGVGGDPATGIDGGAVSGNKGALDIAKSNIPKTDPGGGTPETLEISGGGSKTLTSGIYRLPQIVVSSSTAYISGNVTLYVDGDITVSGGSSSIVILPGGSLTIYANGTVTVSGGGIVNQNADPKDLLIYGTATNTKMDISGGSALYGGVYAPNADITLSGDSDVYGSVVGSTVTITGSGSVHYDENLQNIGYSGPMTVKLISWESL